MSEDEMIHMLQSYVGMSKKDNHRPILDKAIETILDLYQKEKEKNKILEEELQKYISGEYFTEKQVKHIEMTRKMFWINKDKIRAKIEELKQEVEKERGTKGLRYSQSGFIQSKINILNELLEEE